MAKKQSVNYDEMAANPNVRRMLDMIAGAEGTAGRGDNGYNISFGGGTFDGYGAHPGKSYSFKQTDGKRNRTTAAGRYQFLNRTATNLQKQMGLSDFSPASQDKMAIELIRQNGALDNVLMGDYEGAINKLGGTWASLPSSKHPQNKRTMEQVLAMGNNPSSVPQAQPAGAPTSVGGTLPVVNAPGGTMVAMPDSNYEQENLAAFALQEYPVEQNTMLANALGQISKAREQLRPDVSLFDTPLPNDLDADILDIIDRVV